MAQQTTNPRNALNQNTPTHSSINAIIPELTMHRDVGLDAAGYSHFHNADRGIIIVCKGDRRGKGIRDEDIAETHIISGEKTIEDWVKFTQDRRGWTDLRGDLEHRAFGPDGLPNQE